jgi:hypothetical protein
MSSSKTYRILTFVFLLLFLAAASWGVYQYLIVHSQSDRITELSRYQDINGPLESQVVQQQIELDSLRTALGELELELQPLQRYSDSAQGVFFEVQIGQFRYFDINAYTHGTIDLRQSKELDVNKILIGRYESHEEALALQSLLRKFGFKTAFVIGRINGLLVSVEDALSALAESNNSGPENVY